MSALLVSERSRRNVIRPDSLPSPYDGRALGIQACGVAIGKIGVLFYGASGCGKSTLLFRIVRCRPAFCPPPRLIGDDRLILTRHLDRLYVAPHPQLSGFLFARGIGFRRFPALLRSTVDVVIRLVPDAPARPPVMRVTGSGRRLPHYVLNPYSSTCLVDISRIAYHLHRRHSGASGL